MHASITCPDSKASGAVQSETLGADIQAFARVLLSALQPGSSKRNLTGRRNGKRRLLRRSRSLSTGLHSAVSSQHPSEGAALSSPEGTGEY